MPLKIEFYGSTDEKPKYAQKFIEEQCPNEVAHKIVERFQLLERHGISKCIRNNNKFRKVSGYPKQPNLYELKVKHDKLRYRILFTINNQTAYMLDGFKKTNSKEMVRHFKKAFNRAKKIQVKK